MRPNPETHQLRALCLSDRNFVVRVPRGVPHVDAGDFIVFEGALVVVGFDRDNRRHEFGYTPFLRVRYSAVGAEYEIRGGMAEVLWQLFDEGEAKERLTQG